MDRKPANALKMARLEHALGMRSTYYFRHVPPVFQPEIMREIAGLGHEIGYHYETLSKCNGDFFKAISLFKQELEEFRRHVPVSTISMHGRPLSPWDNRDLWNEFDFRRYGILGECYLSIDYTKVTYLSDTGRTWHPGRHNIRDHVAGKSPDHLHSTADLINYLANGNDNCLCLLTHPNRWADSTPEWCLEWASDLAVNMVKKGLSLRSQKK